MEFDLKIINRVLIFHDFHELFVINSVRVLRSGRHPLPKLKLRGGEGVGVERSKESEPKLGHKSQIQTLMTTPLQGFSVPCYKQSNQHTNYTIILTGLRMTQLAGDKPVTYLQVWPRI